MATDTIANRHRPKKFADVVGQEKEVEVLKKIVAGSWQPNAVMLTGPFGTGKTTLARLLTRAMHCDNRQPDENGVICEPCGECTSCKAMNEDNNPHYIEVDAASQGAVSDVRGMKDLLSYRTGTKRRVICYDESHMLSAQAQNALLQTLEEGSDEVLFVFCTTESNKMLPTVQSRCIVLNMRLLTPGQIRSRLEVIAASEGVEYDLKALRIIATHVRGHARDALVMFEQLSRMAPKIEEGLVRSYLRLDRHVEVYTFLTTSELSKSLELLEGLLCNYAVSELAQTIGSILVNAYKVAHKTGDFTDVDRAWLQRVIDARGVDTLLDSAEAILALKVDYATIDYGIAGLGRILLEGKADKISGPASSLKPGGAPSPTPSIPGGRRKPGK